MVPLLGTKNAPAARTVPPQRELPQLQDAPLRNIERRLSRANGNSSNNTREILASSHSHCSPALLIAANGGLRRRNRSSIHDRIYGSRRSNLSAPLLGLDCSRAHLDSMFGRRTAGLA